MKNGDKVVPEVIIELGGKPRKLVFNLWAFYLLEKETGKSALNGDIFNTLTATDVLILAWAGLQSNEKISIEEVGKLLFMSDLPELSQAVMKAFNLASPVVDEKNAGAVESQAPQAAAQ